MVILPNLVAYAAVFLCGLVLLAGWLARRCAIKRCAKAGGQPYNIELFYAAVPLVLPVALLLGFAVAGSDVLSLRAVAIMCGISLALCCASAIYARNRVELYDDRCVSVSGLSKMELDYRMIRDYVIIGEKGATKVEFSTRYGSKLHFYSSIRGFNNVIDLILAKARLTRRDER